VCPLKPPFAPFRGATLGVELTEESLEVRVGGDALQSLPRHGLQNDPGIVCRVPEIGVHPLPELVRGMVVGPAEVQGELSESIRDLGLGESFAMGPSTHFSSIISSPGLVVDEFRSEV
jgi:hypothetical protein